MDLSGFGNRERGMFVGILNEWNERGLPKNFSEEAVSVGSNQNSGYVYLTNEDFEVVMMNGETLEMFFSCPQCGHEGFLGEMEHNEDDDDCQEYLKEIGVNQPMKKKLNELEALEKMTAHLLKQKKRSLLAGSATCAYRGENGLMCAVGALIPTDKYLPEMEGFRCNSSLIQQVLEDVLERSSGMNQVLREVQAIHDNVPPLKWAEHLNDVKTYLLQAQGKA